MGKKRSVSNASTKGADSRSKSVPTKKDAGKQKRSSTPSSVEIRKRKRSQSPLITKKQTGKKISTKSASPSPVKATPVKGRKPKKMVTPPAKQAKVSSPELQKKRKGNNKQSEVIVVSDSEEYVLVTPLKKKAAKNQEKAVEKAGSNKPTTPIKQSTTPMKGAGLPKRKKQTEEEKRPLPVDILKLVRESVLAHKHHKLTAEKILELIREDYKNVSEVVIFTAIAELFR